MWSSRGSTFCFLTVLNVGGVVASRIVEKATLTVTSARPTSSVVQRTDSSLNKKEEEHC